MAGPTHEVQDALAAEAARYALLRRLAPSIRHELVVHLQPVGMLHELLDRRLKAPEPRLADIQETADKMNRLTKAAMASSLDVIGWLSPDESAATTLPATLTECLALLRSSLGFRGFAVRSEVGDLPQEVRKSAARSLVCAALLHLTDVHAPPAAVVLTAAASEAEVVLEIEVEPGEGDAGFSTAPAYRPLTLQDVMAIAGAESARAEEREDGLRLRFPLVGLRPRG